MSHIAMASSEKEATATGAADVDIELGETVAPQEIILEFTKETKTSPTGLWWKKSDGVPAGSKVVNRVEPGSVAAGAGLKADMVVLRINGIPANTAPVSDMEGLIQMTILPEGAPAPTAVLVGTIPAPTTTSATSGGSVTIEFVKESIDTPTGLFYKKDEGSDSGTKTVSRVEPGSLADVAGLKAGMKILTINGVPAVASPKLSGMEGLITMVAFQPPPTTGTAVTIEFTKPFKDTPSGLYYKANEGADSGTKTVSRVEPGGLAEAAGLQAGMKILTINGVPAAAAPKMSEMEGLITIVAFHPPPQPARTAVTPVVARTQYEQPNAGKGCYCSAGATTFAIGLLVFLFVSIIIGIVIMVSSLFCCGKAGTISHQPAQQG